VFSKPPRANKDFCAAAFGAPPGAKGFVCGFPPRQAIRGRPKTLEWFRRRQLPTLHLLNRCDSQLVKLTHLADVAVQLPAETLP